MITFRNVAGKIDSEGERNYKFISGELTIQEAIEEMKKSKGYDFNEIEVIQDGNTIGEVIITVI